MYFSVLFISEEILNAVLPESVQIINSNEVIGHVLHLNLSEELLVLEF